MKYISVFSGIEAATVAWRPLGWEAIAFSEIEPFPCQVLKHYYPDVPNLGDISKVDWRKFLGTVDLVVGGSPCQSFSVAGSRTGLDGASGLVREYFRLLSECKPRWFLWENVPGVVSSNGGLDWIFILREWHKLGYNVSFRVLDAQYAGVPQRRRRIFAVGYLGDWRPPAKVLFEQYSLQRHSAPSRKARKADPGAVERGSGKAGGELAGCVSSKWAKGTGGPAGDECYNLVTAFEPGAMSRIGGYVYDDIAPTLRAEPGDNLPAVCPIAFKVRQGKEGGGKGYLGNENQAFTLSCNQDKQIYCAPVAPAIGASGPPYSRPGNERVETEALAVQRLQVRRLTPLEAERLQGFPDGWTDIPYKGKPAPDGARYKALGNSMAVPCMAWIGRRIQMVEEGKL